MITFLLIGGLTYSQEEINRPSSQVDLFFISNFLVGTKFSAALVDDRNKYDIETSVGLYGIGIDYFFPFGKRKRNFFELGVGYEFHKHLLSDGRYYVSDLRSRTDYYLSEIH